MVEFKAFFNVATAADLPELPNAEKDDLFFGEARDTEECYIYVLEYGWLRYMPNFNYYY